MRSHTLFFILLISALSTACESVAKERATGRGRRDSVVEASAWLPPKSTTVHVRTIADPATPEACAQRRARVAQQLGAGLLVIGAGADLDDRRYRSDDDFYWLTGISSPDATLVLEVATGKLTNETLYLHPQDPTHELWNGPRLAPGRSTERASGIQTTRALYRYEKLPSNGGKPSARVELYAADLLTAAQDRARILCSDAASEKLLEQAGIAFENVSVFLEPLQAVKDEHEIRAMRAAIDITQEALAEAMRRALPGAYEFTAEALLESGFRLRGAETVAFPSICGSGPNSCVLHYRANRRQLAEGELLVLDVGAKYKRYCADVTRTIPVDGTFSPRQREIYTLVYKASRRAAAVLRPGATLREAHAVAQEFLTEHGMGAYFPHGIGHGLGLEVHDAPRNADVLRPGMVVTIEPGIYIAEENLGVRIEDDYLITEKGSELLSGLIPTHPDELESFLARIRRP